MKDLDANEAYLIKFKVDIPAVFFVVGELDIPFVDKKIEAVRDIIFFC